MISQACSHLPRLTHSGKTITIINRSEIVGRPLAAMLANDGAIIYSVDIDSIFLFKRGALRKTEATPESAVLQSDAVITVRKNQIHLAPNLDSVSIRYSFTIVLKWNASSVTFKV